MKKEPLRENAILAIGANSLSVHSLPIDGVYFVDDLRNISFVPEQTMRIGYNAVVYCSRGRIELEMGIDQSADNADFPQGKRIVVGPYQVLLLPSAKLVQPMMMSTDVVAKVLLLSDKVLRELLGPQVEVWNRAMYLSEVNVIDGGDWINNLGEYANQCFLRDNGGRQLFLIQEIIFSFLRTMFLLICEELLRSNAQQGHRSFVDGSSSLSEHELFDQFMSLLTHEQLKRRKVSYYASQLNITPKYLSVVCSRVSGKSPLRWINESVMNDICQLLRNTHLSVKEISNRLNFPNPSFFSKYFREQSGVSPLEYRKRVRRTT